MTDTVRQLIDDGVRSLEQLAVLLVLSQEPGKQWTVDAVRQVAMLAQPRVDEAFTALERAGLVARADPSDPHVRLGERVDIPALQALRAAYERDRTRVVNAFFACNLDSLRSFASAFKVRRPS